MPRDNKNEPKYNYVRPYEVVDHENRSRRIIGLEILYKSQVPVWARGLEVEFTEGKALHRRQLRDFVAAQLEQELPGHRKPKHMGKA